MGNAPSDEEAAVGLAPGTPNSQIRSTGEPASTEGQTRGNEILTTLSSGDTGEDSPVEGEGVIIGLVLIKHCRYSVRHIL